MSFLKSLKENRSVLSLYSMVSCSELTPGSLEVWQDLPDSIKYDPVFAPFKQLYEEQLGEFTNVYCNIFPKPSRFAVAQLYG